MPLFRRKVEQAAQPPPTIDAVAIEPDGTVDLILGYGATQSLESLKERLQSYVSFALDGRMVRMYPETSGRRVKIIVAPDEEPTSDLASLIESAAPRFASYGLELILR